MIRYEYFGKINERKYREYKRENIIYAISSLEESVVSLIADNHKMHKVHELIKFNFQCFQTFFQRGNNNSNKRKADV